ncbi:MAG: 3-keto-5-aminohexanoate cleavage protein [Flavobacteriaceae bacterium]
MPRAVWLEAALNGAWTTRLQPNVPVLIDDVVAEGIACAEAGAAVIHVHAYDQERGVQNDDWQVYARIIEGIRARVDTIVYPTVPFPGADRSAEGVSAKQRFAHTAELARRGLIEWAVVDPGSVNLARFDEIAAGGYGSVYANPPDHIEEGVTLAARYGFHPSYAIYEPGFTRLGAALARAVPRLPQPIYRLMFSAAYAWGLPPEPYALETHLRILADEAGAVPWMAAGLGVDILPLAPLALARGGHLRVGLEDVPLGAAETNIDLVRKGVAAIEAAGGRPATAAEIRAALVPDAAVAGG